MIVPFIVIAIVSTILLSRRTREPARTEDQVSIWWLVAFAGAATVVTGAAIPYYRFMNASAAPMALVGLGAFVAIRWLLARPCTVRRCVAGALVVRSLVVASLGSSWSTGSQNRWVSETNQWANQQRADLARRRATRSSQAAGERPNVLVVNYGDTTIRRPRRTPAYGWAKTYTNVFRTGLPGDAIERSITYFGTLENFLAGRAHALDRGERGLRRHLDRALVRGVRRARRGLRPRRQEGRRLPAAVRGVPARTRSSS